MFFIFKHRHYGYAMICLVLAMVILLKINLYESGFSKFDLIMLKETESVPAPVEDEHLEKLPMISNCSTFSIPREWHTSNFTLEQLGQRIELKDCTISGDIEQIFSRRREIITTECEALESFERDLLRSQWTWQPLGVDGMGNQYLDENQKYRMCQVPKAGSTSWVNNNRETRKKHLTMIGEVQHILPVRHPFSRLASAYNDKFCSGYLFTCHKSKNKNIFYGHQIPLLITSGRINASIELYKEISKAKSLRGVGKQSGVNQELSKIIQKIYSTSLKDIEEKFQGTHVPFKDFIYHIFWTYRHDVGDHHWVPQTTLCNACSYQWTYVLHLENNDQESKYMLEKLGYNKTIIEKKNVSSKKRSPDYLRFFTELPVSMIVKLVKYYYYDFLLLGYSL